MRPLPILAFALLGLAACQPSKPAELAVRDAWVRLPAVPGRPAAAYFTLSGGTTADRLVAIASPRVERIELHEGGMDGRMTTMRPVAGVAVPAGGTVTFAPGGDHAMLFGVDGTIASGATLPLELSFASGRRLLTQARAVSAGSAAPGEAGH